MVWGLDRRQLQLVLVLLATGCVLLTVLWQRDDPPFRQHTASDVIATFWIPTTVTDMPRDLGIADPRWVAPREVWGPEADTYIRTTDVLRFETPTLCAGCGGYVLSFDSNDALYLARDFLAQRDAALITPAWIIIVRANVLALWDARWSAMMEDYFTERLCVLSATCPLD
jgi:hypothetical protein